MQLTLLYGVLPLPRRNYYPGSARDGQNPGSAPEFGGHPEGLPARPAAWGKTKLMQIVINIQRGNEKGSRRIGRDPFSGRELADLVGLPAQEGRDIELIVIPGIMHRCLPAKRVEAVVRRPLGIF